MLQEKTSGSGDCFRLSCLFECISISSGFSILIITLEESSLYFRNIWFQNLMLHFGKSLMCFQNFGCSKQEDTNYWASYKLWQQYSPRLHSLVDVFTNRQPSVFNHKQNLNPLINILKEVFQGPQLLYHQSICIEVTAPQTTIKLCTLID